MQKYDFPVTTAYIRNENKKVFTKKFVNNKRSRYICAFIVKVLVKC